MTLWPQFSYHISTNPEAIDDQHPAWHERLPVKRGASPAAWGTDVTYGDYFAAIKSFLLEGTCSKALAGVGQDAFQAPTDRDGRHIHISLMKHGEYYHPSRIHVTAGGRCQNFVMNVAVSSVGRSMINDEVRFLERITDVFPYTYTPQVYARGDIGLDGNRSLGMFLGDWFDGYHEFHQSANPDTGDRGIIVWDDDSNRPYFLDEARVEPLYAHAAKIITGFYNLSTFEYISAWHHAAGDFILCDNDDGLSLKLVTVRGYRPLLEQAEPDIGTMLDTLLVFFINLTIRMRLDREDGVGDFTWADDRAVRGAVRGFFQGLDLQVSHGLIPGEFVDAFSSYLASMEPGDLLAWATDITRRIHPNAPETPLVMDHLGSHISTLCSRLKTIRP